MGTSRSFAEFEKKARQAAADLTSKSDKQILNASATRAKKLIGDQVRSAVPSGRLNVGKNGARVSVYSRQFKVGAHLVAARGPLHIVERPTKAHNIPRAKGDVRAHTTRGKKRKKASTVRKTQRTLLSFGPNQVAVGPVKHPGTRGKRPWERGVKRFMPSAGKTFEKGVDSIMRKVFG